MNLGFAISLITLTKDSVSPKGVDPTDMILNLVTFKVIAELDDIFGDFYLTLVVKKTDDGSILEDDLLDYEELNTQDL